MTTLIVLALVFVFVALRLWSVLGRRTGHEQPIAKPESVPIVRGLSLKAPDADRPPVVGQEPAPSVTAASGLRAIAATSTPGSSRIEWAWALNAASSVLGSVIAMFIAIQYGLGATLFSAAVCYLLAALLSRTLAKQVLSR